MRDQTCFQDWETVILEKRTPTTHKTQQTLK